MCQSSSSHITAERSPSTLWLAGATATQEKEQVNNENKYHRLDNEIFEETDEKIK